MAKQLRRRGQLVRYKPPRKSVVFAEKKIFQKIGPKERDALADFEYLQVKILKNKFSCRILSLRKITKKIFDVKRF